MSAVHPHTRGDHDPVIMLEQRLDGSPPHTWGPRRSLGSASPVFRFTPTHVGTTEASIKSLMASMVHPHTRGDHWTIPQTILSFRGSPPHTWGPPNRTARLDDGYRFTPTHVGTTAPPYRSAKSWPVHPHTRGDHQVVLFLYSCYYGSPPHTWGPLRSVRPGVRSLRFTPTHVGTTLGMLGF